MPSGPKKFTALIILITVLSTSLVGIFLDVKPAHAQGGPTTIIGDIPRKIESITTKIGQGIKSAIINAGSRAAAYALQKVAYDSAVWLASGGKGQGPMFFTDSPGKYLENVASEAAGAGIEELGKPFGLNLCKIPNIKIDLALRIGLRTRFAGPPKKPACTGAQFLKTWKDGFSKFNKPGGPFIAFNTSLKVDDSDFGVYTQATEKIGDMVATQKASAVLGRQEGQGFKPKTTQISGQNQIPASTVRDTASGNGPVDKTIQQNQAQLNAAIAANDVKIFPSVLSIFLSTLGSQIIKNFQEKGMLPFGACIGGYGGEACKKSSSASLSKSGIYEYASEGITALGRATAQNFFSYLTSVKLKEAPSYDLIAELNSCPDSPGTYNCRAGDDLVSAINQKLTIGEALKRGVLDGNRRLIPPGQGGKNTDINCYKDSYCLNNIKVLRQVRVLPLGFEIAIQRSNPEKPWTLSQVVSGFNDCEINTTTGKVVGDYSPLKPFCHLIDPNWVLKAPEAKCNALVNGPNLLSSETPERLQDCVDLQTCVAYNASGDCVNYAYCTREKNVWKFAADSCDAQYDTCRAFQNSEGQTVSYLYRTLDTGFCNAGNVGCTAYSLTKENGEWATTSFNFSTGNNKGIYFNNKVETGCSESSVGCSAFQVASANELLYMKKAPDYLKCYDYNPATSQIDWPRNAADLSRLSQSPECQKYAAACTPDEASCNWYTPDGGGNRIPGRFTPAKIVENQVVWNDQCDGRCVGYDAYREMPTNYSNGQDVAYIIPSSGQTCSAVDVGCSSFTNLSTSIGGVENTEYYSYLRYCQKPTATAPGKNFTTYEGSKESGFQLKTYVLLSDTNGGPDYFDDTGTDQCTEDSYKSGSATPDCRQFNDQTGNVYYRLLSKTIPVTEACTAFRLNNPELVNGRCPQGGELRNGSCIYNGIPKGVSNTAGISQTCSASADTCRAYKGNAGNNVQTVYNESFESGDTGGWAGGTGSASLSTVSPRTGDHSLEISNGSASKQLSLERGKTYELSFWAAGTGGNMTVRIVDGSGNQLASVGEITYGDLWKEFRFGQIDLNNGNSDFKLQFTVNAGSRINIDNIKLVKVSENLYLVKKSLKVDPVCDSNQKDNLPGEALGCKAYSDPQNRKFFLTNFSFLCRDNAIGCTALFDTKNTPNNSGPEIYNVWLVGASGEMVSRTLGSDTYSCQVQRGQSGCYVNVKGHTLLEVERINPVTLTRRVRTGFLSYRTETYTSYLDSVVTSTVVIPADTPSSTPIYLIANQEASCNQADLGCTYAGYQKRTEKGVEFVTTTIKNDPATYANNLCQLEAVGCGQFTDGTDTQYFKDPLAVDQNICVYKSNIPYSGKSVSGWFLKDGPTTPCYGDYFVGTNVYGIWSYGNNDKYQNYVGECPPAQNKCTEFIDRADNNRPYYLVKDDKLSEGDCNGQVSQKAGCAMFDQTSIPNKLWNTTSTLAESEKNDSKLVTPISNGYNDANVILKVAQDRECGEWLQCGSSFSTFDDQNNRYKTVCQGLVRCQSGTYEYECGSGVTTTFSNRSLTEALYRGRTVNWADMDYSGYSLLNFFPVEELEQVNFNTSTENADWRLAKKIPCGNNCSSLGDSLYSCGQTGNAYVDKQSCGVPGNEGVCINRVCLKSINNLETAEKSPSHGCRAYPESDSPFPGTSKIRNASGFREARVCDELTPDACDCDYRKVEYGDIIKKYWNYSPSLSRDWDNRLTWSKGNPPPGICLGGTDESDPTAPKQKHGAECANDFDCGTGGICQLLKSNRNFIGWKGFCLEKDTTRHVNGEELESPCLTWYPVESLVGVSDINNQHTEAGGDWHGQSVGANYCLYSQGTSTPMSFNIKFATDGFKLDSREFCSKRMGNEGGCDGDINDMNGTNYGFGGPQFIETVVGDSSRFQAYGTIFGRTFVDVAAQRTGGNGYAFPLQGFSEIKKEDIARIEIKVRDSEGNKNLRSGIFYIFPNNNSIRDNSQTYYNVYTKDGGNGVAVAGNYQGSQNDYVLFYSSSDDQSDTHLDLFTNGNVAYQNAGANGIHGNIFGRNWYGASDNGRDLWSNSASNYGTYCPANGEMWSGQSGTWHALRLVFSTSTGKFTGIYTAFCSADEIQTIDGGSGNGDGQPYRIDYEVKFQMHEWCPVVTDATQDFSESNVRARANTNNLYSVRDSYTLIPFGYKYSTINTAFGSIGTVSPSNKQISVGGPGNIGSLDVYTPGSGCPGTSFRSCGPKDIRHLEPISTRGQTYSRTTIEDGVSRLQNLFGSVLSNYQYINGSYSMVASGELGQSNTNMTERGVPPQIRPLGTRYTNLGKYTVVQYQELNQQGFTVNGRNGGNVLAPGNSFKAVLNFFMFASSSQMPIRSVAVDWGDGSQIVPVDGFLRNNRGLLATKCVNGSCQVSDTNRSVGTTCNSDTDCQPVEQCVSKEVASEYGLIKDQTCDNRYFNAEHPYSCSSDLRPCASENDTGCYSDNDQWCGGALSSCCIFVPKVQIKDNWGWCNGTCGDASSPGKTGCYDESWTNRPGDVDECSGRGSNSTPWTKFNGKIILPTN